MPTSIPRPAIVTLLALCLAGVAPALPASGPEPLPPCLDGWIFGSRLYDGDLEIAATCASDTTRTIRLTHWPGRDIRPVLNPAGKTLAFAHEQGGAWAIWFLDMRTRELEPMPKAHVSEVPNQWKDNATLVHAASQSSIYCWDSWTYALDTARHVPITDEGATRCESSGSAFWDPARSTYFYTSEFSPEIRRRSETGTPLPPSPRFEDCDLSPHLGMPQVSKRGVIATNCFGPNEIRLLDADTFEARSPPVDATSSYAWSADGARLLVDLAGEGAFTILDPTTGCASGTIRLAREAVSWWGRPLTSGAHTVLHDRCRVLEP